jgi:hypothetical protein
MVMFVFLATFNAFVALCLLAVIVPGYTKWTRLMSGMVGFFVSNIIWCGIIAVIVAECR